MSTASAEPARKPLWKRLLKPVLWVAVLAFVFGYFLPQIISYEDIWQAIKGLSWWQLAILLALGLSRMITEGITYRALLPELALSQAIRTWLIAFGGTQFIPPPADSIAFYALARSYKVESRRALTASFLTFLYPTLGRLLLPLVAIVPFVIFAVATDDETLLILLITLAVAIVTAVVGWLVLRSERSAYRLGNAASRAVSWVLERVHRHGVGTFGPALARFRADSIGTVRDNWKIAALGVSTNFLVTYLILLFSLRFLGLSNGNLPWVEVLAAFALSQWAQTVIPISPGGLGVADAVLISSLVSVAPGNNDVITAGVLLWRVFYWAIPIPLGLVAVRRWQRANPNGFAEARATFSKSKREEAVS